MNTSPEVVLSQTQTTPSAPATAYEAPAIEAVVTLDELEREVHYAGVATSVILTR